MRKNLYTVSSLCGLLASIALSAPDVYAGTEGSGGILAEPSGPPAGSNAVGSTQAPPETTEENTCTGECLDKAARRTSERTKVGAYLLGRRSAGSTGSGTGKKDGASGSSKGSGSSKSDSSSGK